MCCDALVLQNFQCLRDLDVLSLPALGAFNHVEGHTLTFLERTESVRLDGRVMDEYIFAVGAAQKAEALRVVKPLHCSLFHCLVPYSAAMYRERNSDSLRVEQYGQEQASRADRSSTIS